MKIRSLVHLSGARGRALDTPIRFPAPCQPSLLTAPETRITIKDADNTEDDYLDNNVKIEDAKKSINFGGRVLCSTGVEITGKGKFSNDGPFFITVRFPNGKRYQYWFDTHLLQQDAIRSRYNIGTFVKLVAKTSFKYEDLTPGLTKKPNNVNQQQPQQPQLELGDARFTYNESGETTTNLIKEAYHIDDAIDNSKPGKPIVSTGPIDIEALRKAGKKSPVKKELSMYEDQKRVQPKDIETEEMNNQAQKPDIIVKVRRSDSKPFGSKYSGFKCKVGNQAWRSDDVGIPQSSPKSKILLT